MAMAKEHTRFSKRASSELFHKNDAVIYKGWPKAYTHSATEETLHFLWNLKIHYCVHKSLPLVPVLSQMHFPTLFPKIHS
jgi:hypothetical protein